MSLFGSLIGAERIGIRLAISFAVVVAIFIVNLLLIGRTFTQLMLDINKIRNETIPYILVVDEMDMARADVQQWLTDVSVTHNRDGYKDAEAAAKRFLSGVEKFKGMYREEKDTHNLKEIEEIETSFNAFYADGVAMSRLYLSQGMRAGNAAMAGFDKSSADISEKLTRFRHQQISEANQITDSTVIEAESTMQVMSFGGLFAAMLATVFAILISQSILKPIWAMQSTMLGIEKTGDFTRRISIQSGDEIGQTAASFNELVGDIQASLHKLHDDIDQLFDSSSALSSASHQVATSSAIQSLTTAQMLETEKELAFGIDRLSKSVRQALERLSRSADLTGQGGEVIHSAASGMKQIADRGRRTSVFIEESRRQSAQISSIASAIKETAEQTILLAQNASIGGGEADERDNRFAAMVAGMCQLAERTSGAADEIVRMIDTMQGAADVAATNISDVVSQAGASIDLADQAGVVINQIEEATKQVLDSVNGVTEGLKRQEDVSDSIARHVEQVAQKSRQYTAVAAETSDSADKLALLAGNMRTTINRFKC